MLEILSQFVKENARDAIVNNPDIPNQRNEEAVSAASGSIRDALKQQVSSGNVSELVNMFKGGGDTSSKRWFNMLQVVHGKVGWHGCKYG
jgi:hypothetical protein